MSLAALWAFAAWVTLREGVNLVWVSVVNSGIAQPIDDLQPELQRERQLSMIRLGNPGSGQRGALDAQRLRTDTAVANFARLSSSGNVKLAESSTLKAAVEDALRQFGNLGTNRNAIDSGLTDRSRTAAVYDDAIDAIFQVDDSLATLDDKGFAKDVRTMVELNRARELVSQEDALVSGILAARRVTGADYLQYVQAVGAQRYAIRKVEEELQATDRVSYDLVTKSTAMARLHSLETAMLSQGRPGRRPPINSVQWRAAADPALSDLSKAVFGGGDRLVNRAKPIGIGVVVRLVLAGGLGLVALITSIIVSITTTRALMRQLERLRVAAHELADRRLPGIVERLGRGEKVDVSAEAPPLEFGNDEVGQVGHAFNSVQETAIRTAVEQAELRRGIRDILLSLARRSQALVHRQLTLLDTMERREDDSTELEDLFRVDHLATRMRRNAENLIVLSGATPARGWRRPVPMIDVVRSSVAEVEDYTRVTVMPMGDVALAGRAVGDIVHLLAELIENAVSFSPPYTQAQVSGHQVAHGYVVEIEDRGLGMTDEILAEINERVTDPPEFNLSSSAHLGLYVVGRLAMRYEVRVSLKHSSYGGTTAVVLIPRELIARGAEEGAEPGLEARGVPVTVGAGGMTATSYGDIRVATEASVLEPPALPTVEPPAPPEVTPPPADVPVAPAEALALAADANGGLPPLPQRTATRPPEPVPPAEPAGAQTTPSGLPVRVPQASITPALLTEGTPAATAPAAEEDDVPSPEQIRRSFGGLQAGTRRGRTDAARSQPPAAEPTPAPDELAEEDNQ
ncbi:nitrate- and nitrite sensing domain-containing protein [Actinomadura sp. DC4]|uniref:sensor histidine kinase n=1 Tax=Actinomadura sp. DC4 TaxID=3055069 RepID=UPI0025B155CC|nr:nitrate- and nitrite sensing domain-containing protein [Actinomadura sp. DC4]MDN3351096.1 nitrate- and nitrite sensing domain-containing protein [Actinomadura sp. DC4]